jgi:hypothetical protein
MTRTTLWGALVSSLALSPVLTRGLSGQGVSICEKAAAIIAKGHTSEADDWAFSALRPCGAAGARAFVAGIAHYRTETDVAALEDFMTQVDNWRDASIFDAVTASSGPLRRGMRALAPVESRRPATTCTATACAQSQAFLVSASRSRVDAAVSRRDSKTFQHPSV